MLVVLNVMRVGHNITQSPGDVIDVSAREAAVLIENGSARPYIKGQDKSPDDFVRDCVETASLDVGRGFDDVPVKRRRVFRCA